VGFRQKLLQKTFQDSSYTMKVEAISKNIFEFTDFMVNIRKVEDVGAQLEGSATYHDSCAALRECKIKQEPRLLLSHVKGLE
jgi:L-lactate dehydrogenase complex protein LldE